MAREHLETDAELERGLILASQSGDAEAISSLYRTYKSRVYAVCLRALRDPALAEDAVHDTFIKALSNLRRFELGRPLGPWLASIARRHCIDLRRRRRSDCSLEQMTENGGSVDVEGRDPFSDDVFEHVLGVERFAKLRQALATLPPRQRHALLLSAIDGWTYAQIASAVGVSHGAVNLLHVRARKRLREAWESLGVSVFLPWLALRDRVRAASARLDPDLVERSQRGLFVAQYPGWFTATSAALALGLALIMAGRPPAPDPTQPPQAVAPSVTSVTLPLAAPATQRDSASPQASDPDEGDLIPRIPGVTEKPDPTPEKSRFSSVEPSPDYEQDHTVFAPGACAEVCGFFITQDGGATWTFRRSVGLALASRFLIPPDYRANGIFAMTVAGLQRSIDGGRTFSTVSPITGLAAVSPGFAEGDRRIIIAAQGSSTMFEYLVDEHETRALSLGLSGDSGYPTALALSPRFPSDPSIFLGRRAWAPSVEPDHRAATVADAWPKNKTSFERCASSSQRCEATALGETPLGVQFSPEFDRDRTIYSLLPRNRLVVSDDMMESFAYRKLPEAEGVSFNQLAVLTHAHSTKLLISGFGGVRQSGGVYVSADRGATWRFSDVKVRGFWSGIGSLAVTSTGRIFAVGAWGGIACSQDGGATWKPRCAAER